MPMILVTPLSAVEESIRRYAPSHMITLLSPEHMIDTPVGLEPDRHLRVGMNDVAETWEAECAPCVAHVNSIIEFGRSWSGERPMLIHCWAGVSRSMATAYTLLCDKVGPGAELEVARAMRARAPHAFPNPLIVRLADEALGRGGRMVSAVQAIGRGTIVAEGSCVELPLKLDVLVT